MLVLSVLSLVSWGISRMQYQGGGGGGGVSGLRKKQINGIPCRGPAELFIKAL